MRVAIIPARGGSKRIPRKNIKTFHGRPIMAYSIDVAKASGIFSDVFVSTEDKEIAAVARTHGAKVVPRPDELARNEIGTQAVVKHVIEHLDLAGEDVVGCLYATAGPLLAPIDLQQGYGMLLYRPCSYVISVGTDPLRDVGGFYLGFASRFTQDLPLHNIHSGYYPMPPDRCIDINTERDWKLAEQMYEALFRQAGHA